MIYTITLNPALDHFLEVGDLKVDDQLCRLREVQRLLPRIRVRTLSKH